MKAVNTRTGRGSQNVLCKPCNFRIYTVNPQIKHNHQLEITSWWKPLAKDVLEIWSLASCCLLLDQVTPNSAERDIEEDRYKELRQTRQYESDVWDELLERAIYIAVSLCTKHALTLIHGYASTITEASRYPGLCSVWPKPIKIRCKSCLWNSEERISVLHHILQWVKQWNSCTQHHWVLMRQDKSCLFHVNLSFCPNQLIGFYFCSVTPSASFVNCEVPKQCGVMDPAYDYGRER